MEKSAFPVQGMSLRNGQQFQAVYYDGMTLRDYFAAKAMQGALSNAYVAERYQMKTWEIAKEAYEMADAMLEARK